jgi:hypothetical protein
MNTVASPHTTGDKSPLDIVPPPHDADDREQSASLENLELTVCYLQLDEIRRDGGTQPRAAIDWKHVKLLEEQMEDGKELEPVTVFYDGESYWLADGFHRFSAHRNQCKEAIDCFIHSGSRRDAVLYSVGANADHKPALPRSREDKRRAVMTLLQDPEWQEWSNCQIAKACRVDEKTVRNIRKTLTSEIRSDDSTRTYKTKHGTIATMDTANIGKTSQSAVLHFSALEAEDKEQERLTLTNRVTVTDDHPLFPGQSGKIAQLPNPDAAIVELDTGERELISLKHLKPIIAQHLKLVEGGLVEIYVPGNNKINGRWGRIAAVAEYTVEVWLRDVDTMTMQKHALKSQQLIPLPLEKEPRLKEICDRLTKLRSCSLDPFEVEILNLLERPVVFTPTELEYLAYIEKRYGIAQD